MPFSYGPSMAVYPKAGYSGGDSMFTMILLILVIVLLVYLIVRKPNTDNERLVKMEKDIEEIKETVKELKRKWEEIE
ncbi:hypothetical protein [Methanotorris igneus]|uniref:Uncharacterized protein n=1 Tax=Methanotorris igneus (strain DSM 5666 / JCM 11834 / Kol 5) TaxID=880724 RepID=F6BC32_METIK|nr:hypothetical protein [Methanotorris igneus]AEF96113.1 hypothetical protein Metig_0559 [Methanotorris igneus Kol 5]